MVLKPFRLIEVGKNILAKFPNTRSLRSKSTESKEYQQNRRPWKVMFFGTDNFSLGTLKRLSKELKHGTLIAKLEVVSSKWPANPVRLYSVKENLVVHEWPIEPQVVENFDVGLVASFGHMIPECVIDAFPLGILNAHGSLLPRWRGAAPVNYAIMHGDSVTGISVMRIRPHSFDKGEIISRIEVPILPTETALQLRSRLSEIGGEALMASLQTLPHCLLEARPQEETGVTYAPKISPDLGMINFKKMSASDIYNRYRALHEFVPLTTSWMEFTLNLLDVTLENTIDDSSTNMGKEPSIKHVDPVKGVLVPGQVLFYKKSNLLKVICSDNSLISIGRLAPTRRKPLKAREFYNGYLSKKDKKYWIFS